MFSKAFVVTAIAALFAGQALGIALDPYDACNCPRNCDYELNSGCKYYSGPSDTSPVLSGRCTKSGDYLVCDAS